MRNIVLIALLTASTLTFAPLARAAERPLSRAEAVAIVHALDTVLLKNYVFPDKAKVIVSFLNAKVEQGGYDALASRDELARALTDDLIKVSGDLHFSVGQDRKWVASFRQRGLPGNAAVERQRAYYDGAQTNFGFDRVGRLPGNIGYLNLSYFADPTIAYDTAAAAMRMVENSDALIIDLRRNNGGYLEMAQFIASYFFSSEKDKLLFDYYYYDDGKRIERGQWVLPGLPGKRMIDKPVYILTSSTSFSSAEWFTYMMKKLGRAKVIGARTSGGAHPVDRKPIDDDFYLQVPIGQIRDPVDHGDFENVGVQPDVEVPSIDALEIAKKLALEELATRSNEKKSDLNWLLPSLTADVAPPAVPAETLQAAVGKYEGRTIGLDRGRLYVIWRERFRAGLTPVAPDLFDVEGVSEFRYRLVSKAGKVIGLERVNRDRTTHMYKRL
jgi:hypothetical protein